MDFHENDLISTYLSDLKQIDECSSKQLIKLFVHKQLGKVLIINNEIQHIEYFQTLYHELLVHLPCSFIPAVKNVLIIGGGSLFAASEVLKYNTVETVTLCDHDRNVLEIMERHYKHASKVMHDSRFKYIEEDAFDFLKDCNKKYDLIINDCFNIIKESDDKKIPLYESLFDLCSECGVCVDIIYRHIFDSEITKQSLEALKSKYNFVLSLVCVPEYPGVLHLETMWGKNGYLNQDAKKSINKCQIENMQLGEQLDYFNPQFIPFYLYLPPYIKKRFSL